MGVVVTSTPAEEANPLPAGVDGKIAGAVPLPQVVQPVTVQIGGTGAEILYGGAAPTLVAGVMQLNVRIPTGITPGDAVPVQLTIGGVTSPTVTLAVSAQ